ncbi:F-BAR domain only protein 2, partial [Bulinus truncatus]
IKENEQPTLDSVQTIQQTTNAVHKAKEIYHTRCMELERLKRDSASQKDIEKAEVKYKRALEEYKTLIEKYKEVRNDFEGKMIGSCHHYQELEEEHICQMKDFIDTFAKSWENEHFLLGQVHQEFKQNCDEMTVQKLITTFVDKKGTGKEKPGPIEFVEPDLSSLLVNRPMSPEPALDKRDSVTEKQKQEASGSPSPVLSDQPGPLSRSVKLRVSRTWFLKNKTRRKEKVKKKGKKEKDEKDNESNEPELQDPNIEVDEEDNGDKNSWYSSDSDSDSDGEESRRKIKVEIRPLSPTPAPVSTIDDIRASVEGLRLSPSAIRKRSQTPIDKKMKRSQSESDTLDKPGNQDLLNLDLFGSSSAASTPAGVNYNITLPSPLSPQTEINWNSANSSAATTPSTNFADISNGKPSTPTLPGPVTSPLSGLPPPIARPPSRTRGLISQPKINGPTSINRSDSNGSMTFTTTSMPIGSSRGPSPLTIGMSDSVPLAIAFTETVNAYFKGHDAQKCVVRIIGNVMMSFPAGVVKVFTENPSPALLSFRIKNADKWEQVISNSSILSKDESQSTSDVHLYEFNMSNLIEHLRQQGEQNKAASYFNIDILKYQVKSSPGVESTPLPLVVYWKCDDTATDFRLDYRYNPKAMSSPVTLKNVTVAVPVDGDVNKMQSLPNGIWDAVNKRATWKLNDISEVSEQESQGCIRAKFELAAGPTKAMTTAIQFAAEGATLSGVDFELAGTGYRISLLKKRFATGKYFVDPEPTFGDIYFR